MMRSFFTDDLLVIFILLSKQILLEKVFSFASENTGPKIRDKMVFG